MKGLNKLGIDSLTSLLEVDLANIEFKRIIASKFEQINLLDYAINLYDRILKQRPEEPQSYRDLALALVKRGKKEDYHRALTLLALVVKIDWDVRFTQIEVIALMELTRIYKDIDISAIAQNDELYSILQQYPICIDIPLVLDIRIILTWDKDIVDIELHVVEPSGETCNSFHNCTSNGGMLSKDMTGGLGPEEYLLRNAEAGEYKIYAKLFTKKGRRVGSGVTVQARIYTYYGNREQEQEYITFARLKEEKEKIYLGSIHWK